MNENKSIHSTFTLRHGICPTLYLNNQPLPPTHCVRFLCILVALTSKTRTLNDLIRLLLPLLTTKYTKLPNKLMLYRSLLRPMWTYGIQFWDATKISNINRRPKIPLLNAMYYFQNPILYFKLHSPFWS